MNLRDLNPCLITARRLPFSEGELYVNQLHLRLPVVIPPMGMCRLGLLLVGFYIFDVTVCQEIAFKIMLNLTQNLTQFEKTR